jgi:hypothetical protein
MWLAKGGAIGVDSRSDFAFSSPAASRPALGPTPPYNQRIPALTTRGWECTELYLLHSPIYFHGVALSQAQGQIYI